MKIPPKFIHRFNVVCIKNSSGFFEQTDELTLKFTRNSKGSRIVKTILKRKTKWEDSHFPISKLTIKLQKPRQWYWPKDRQGQWNRTTCIEKKYFHVWSADFWQVCQDNSKGHDSSRQPVALDMYPRELKNYVCKTLVHLCFIAPLCTTVSK